MMSVNIFAIKFLDEVHPSIFCCQKSCAITYYSIIITSGLLYQSCTKPIRTDAIIFDGIFIMSLLYYLLSLLVM